MLLNCGGRRETRDREQGSFLMSGKPLFERLESSALAMIPAATEELKDYGRPNNQCCDGSKQGELPVQAPWCFHDCGGIIVRRPICGVIEALSRAASHAHWRIYESKHNKMIYQVTFSQVDRYRWRQDNE